LSEFQINKTQLTETRLLESHHEMPQLQEGEIDVQVEKFGFSANNITYALMGDILRYWQFFPAGQSPSRQDNSPWGVLPVWGFAKVAKSSNSELKVGERLFGYFPPATSLKMKPASVASGHFFDASDHRLELPRGYNIYQRVDAEPGYNKAHDELRMLLFPLYITSFVIWDQLKENNWYGAEQVLVVSASSKTSIGLAHALHFDKDAPDCVGLTSTGNAEFVEGLNLYTSVCSYEDIENDLPSKKTVIVDMSGNADILGRVHEHLGVQMLKTLNVGVTHWESSRKHPKINRDRSETFFAPSRIQHLMKLWGAAEFNNRALGFVAKASQDSLKWLELELVGGLHELAEIYPEVLNGKIAPQRGLIFKV